jgi:phage shock protein PspC (stress-responsive transcriptional regulator)
MEMYQHSKVITGILVSFALTHILAGLARIVQHPRRWPMYWIHLIWVVFAFFYVISFWWWEFELEKLPSWNFALYVFVTLYGVLLYLLCALLMPRDFRANSALRSVAAREKAVFVGRIVVPCSPSSRGRRVSPCPPAL